MTPAPAGDAGHAAGLNAAGYNPLTVVVWIGVITALISALIALAQFDIKRILAYSTVSQLGLMMVSLGVGGVAAGIMHLLAHGFFKALLFLGAGSVIHGTHHEQDIRKMGGLRGPMRVTFFTYAIGMMALSGVPLFFSGAWTKEEILHATAHWSVSRVPHYLTMAGVVLTALYMTRQMIYVFFGRERTAAEHAHESPRVMTLAADRARGLHDRLERRGHAGLAVAARLSQRRSRRAESRPALSTDSLRRARAGRGGHRARSSILPRQRGVGSAATRAACALRAFSKTECGSMSFTRSRSSPWRASPRGFRIGWIDTSGMESCARSADSASSSASPAKGFDEHAINAGMDGGSFRARGLGRMLSAAHSGQVQIYLGAVAFGMLALLLLFAWLG